MEYDNTNTGAFYKPYDEQKFSGNGRLDINGEEHKAIMISSLTGKGNKIIRVYLEAGAMFVNDQKGNDKAPTYTGKLNSHDLQIAAWKRVQESTGTTYLGIVLSKKDETYNTSEVKEISQDTSSKMEEDEIPF